MVERGRSDEQPRVRRASSDDREQAGAGRERGREREGVEEGRSGVGGRAYSRRRGTSWIGVVLGVLAALGTGIILGAIVGGLVGGSGFAGIVGLLLTILIAYVVGGYVAGRMAGRSGVRHGLLVALLALIISIVLALLGAVVGSALVENSSGVSLQGAPQNLGGILTVTSIVALVLPFVGGGLGGAMGENASRPRDSRVDHAPHPRDFDEREIFVDVLRIVVSILLPPLGVFWQVGLTGQFWLNVVLTILGYVPGLAHAVYIILTRRG